MSDFSCNVVRLKIVPHPNADAIEIAEVGGYQSIVKKGQFFDGDLGVYIPEQAIMPEWMLKELGFWDEFKGKGVLSGSAGNRVKAIKLRGVVSQGIILALDKGATFNQVSRPPIKGQEEAYAIDDTGRWPMYVNEGFDVAEFLGIVKYSPPLPSHMNARVVGVDLGATHNYDFENIKKNPSLFDDGEDVVITEKIHGTLIQISVVPTEKGDERYHKGRVVVSSKGMGAKGYALDTTDETNLYAQAANKHGLLDKMLERFGNTADDLSKPVILFAEVFGKTLSGAGIQDLTYTGEQLDLRVFDICIGNRGSEMFLSWRDLVQCCNDLGVKHVPMLYFGPYTHATLLKHTDGLTTICGPNISDKAAAHIREGVVVKSAVEARHPRYGRKIAKSISDAYLLRKGNVTEFN